MGVIIKATLLGLSTGIYCLGYCLPVIFPLVFSEQQNSTKQRTRLIFEFSLGRLAAYLIFGGIVGYLGNQVNDPIIKKITAVSIIVLSILLITFSIYKGFPKSKICSLLQNLVPSKQFPMLMGVFTGLNICPPFLLAVTYVFDLGKVMNGILFFFVFFLATSVYLIPFIFLGFYSKYEQMRWIAQISGILCGILFFGMGIMQILAH